MDFFTHQAKARQQTKVLVMLFILAIILIIIAINLVFFLAVAFHQVDENTISLWFKQPYWKWITLLTIGIILLTSLWRNWQLGRSTLSLVQSVNATPIIQSQQTLAEKTLLNVVEEMSIASGMPIPEVFIMREESTINAFVAGLEPSKAILVVTQGLLDHLNREALQAVIAHEYSHIFHGDMRINVKLIGVLAGLLVISQIGHGLLRGGRRSSNNKNSSALAVLVIGLGLFIVGYIGLFFGRLIKAGISRQREFLADASAVQYTRNKSGICQALYQIGQHSSLLSSPKAEEMSHLCFGQAIKYKLSGWLATHPPIAQRISAIDPHFTAQVDFDINLSANQQQNSSTKKTFTDTANFTAMTEKSPLAEPPTASITSNSILSSVGHLSEKQYSHAAHLLQTIPAELLAIARGENQSCNSQNLLVSLIIYHQKVSRFQQISALKNAHNIQALTTQLSPLTMQQQHALFDIALAKLVQLDAPTKTQLEQQLIQLINRPTQCGLTEFVFYALIVNKLKPLQPATKTINQFAKLGHEINGLFSLLYQHSQLSDAEKNSTFSKQMKVLGISQTMLSNEPFSPERLTRMLENLHCLHPFLKKEVFNLAIDIIQQDGMVTDNEYELLRLLGEYFECPVPINIGQVTD
ncbi:M48 family metallopeptidase [Aliikangiella maris]|uniref:M48 family metallopeptidase n=2 Tax=Aliikangiella maris TaxID=3162458 RepID=A0ABV2BRL7_9GAMM